MTCFFLILGLFFIGIGFAVKASPDLIIEYNTMVKEQNSLVVKEFHKAAKIFNHAVILGAIVYIFAQNGKSDLRR